MAYAMADLGWKTYIINASWNVVFLIGAYFLFVETKGLKLEEIAAKFKGPGILEGIPVSDASSLDNHGNIELGGDDKLGVRSAVKSLDA